MINQQQTTINETVNKFFKNWSTDETPINILGQLLNAFLNDPFAESITEEEEQQVSEQITQRTLSIGLVMRFLLDLEENQHLKKYAFERVNAYFAGYYQPNQDNIRELLVHFINVNDKQNFEVALTVPAVGAIMEFLTSLQIAVNKKQLQPVEAN